MSRIGAELFTPFVTVHTSPAFSHTNARPSGANVRPVGWFQVPPTCVTAKFGGRLARATATRTDAKQKLTTSDRGGLMEAGSCGDPGKGGRRATGALVLHTRGK